MESRPRETAIPISSPPPSYHEATGVAPKRCTTSVPVRDIQRTEQQNDEEKIELPHLFSSQDCK